MCPTITVGSFFFRHERSTFLFICSTTSNLNNFKPQQLQPQKRVQKKRKNKTDVHNLEITLKIPHFFSELCDFLKLFGLNIFPQRVPPLIFLMFCNTMDVKKSQSVPPFTFFGTVTLFKNLIKKIFWEIFSCLQKGPPFNFFNIFYNQLEFHKARRVPLLNFEP